MLTLQLMLMTALSIGWGCDGRLSPFQTVSPDTATAPDTATDTDSNTDTSTSSDTSTSIDTGTDIVFELGTTAVYVVETDKEHETTTLGPVTGQADLSLYGGDISRNVGGTGFFQTRLVDGNWFFVDPDGYLYISLALNSVEEGGTIALPEDIEDIGFNGIGNWSAFEAINSGDEKIPYTTKYSFLVNFAGDETDSGGTDYLHNLLLAGVLPVVFSDFDQFCDEFAQQIATLKDDPWMLGKFSDDELPFYNDSPSLGDVLDRWFLLGTDDLYYQYAENWLTARGKSVADYDDEDKNAFAAHIVSVYYAKVSAAIKKYDPNHLYLGTRFHEGAKWQSYIMEAAGPFVDVVSVNYYDAWTPSAEDMDMWLASAGKPFIVSAFYVKGADAGLGNEEGAGWEVLTQADRGLFYTHWLLNFYTHPGAIGTHWFRYIDKVGQDSNKGFLTEQYEWYVPLKDAAWNTNRQIYKLVEFLR